MQRTPDNSEVVIVTVGGREFKTALYNDVQRFMPHNDTPDHLAEKMADWDAWLNLPRAKGVVHERVPSGIYDPNSMVMDYYNGVYTQDEILSYETNSGYSVCGLEELSMFSDLEIINPTWDEE